MTKEVLGFLRRHIVYFRLEETVTCRPVSSSSSAVCCREGLGGSCGYTDERSRKGGWAQARSRRVSRKAVKHGKEFRFQWRACLSSDPHSATFCLQD